MKVKRLKKLIKGCWTDDTKGEKMKTRSGLTTLEQEVVITFNAKEDWAEIYTCNPSFTLYCRKLKLEETEANGFGPTFKCPKSWVKIKAKRILSPKQLANARKAVQTMHHNRRIKSNSLAPASQKDLTTETGVMGRGGVGKGA